MFPGQHANENILARVEQSGLFWLKLAMRWWWALTFLYGICVFFISLIVENLVGVLSLWVILEFATLLLLVTWHLRQREKRKIYITNERIIRFNGKEQFSMNLDEIRDIKARKDKKFGSTGQITFNGVSPLHGKHLPDVQALAKYVNELLRLKRAGSKVFPKYK